MKMDEFSLETGNFEDFFVDNLNPRYLAKALSYNQFYNWCRSGAFTMASSVKVYDIALREFEKYELYEHCAMIRDAKLEWLDM